MTPANSKLAAHITRARSRMREVRARRKLIQPSTCFGCSLRWLSRNGLASGQLSPGAAPRAPPARHATSPAVPSRPVPYALLRILRTVCFGLPVAMGPRSSLHPSPRFVREPPLAQTDVILALAGWSASKQASRQASIVARLFPPTHRARIALPAHFVPAFELHRLITP
ncbi:hypothetical protein BDY21DRAFT_126803 [Lineolata rhizophorae]|uniref:Uncharacterized protein n=1 Tax=Lineolata rhizophorae TaxID=578093 RepID=A0A6A6NQB9_9PEZI|nr:hypothetical protein BDY21DRAFT_126803 [Lineolata rhizophorae]